MFSRHGYTTRALWRLPDVWICEESKMATFERKKIHIMYISARIHDIPSTAIGQPMCSGSGYTTILLRRLPDVWISCESKMASVTRKLSCAIFDSLQIHTPGSLTSWDMRYVTSTSGYRPAPPSLIYPKFTRRAVSAVVLLLSCSPPPKTWV